MFENFKNKKIGKKNHNKKGGFTMAELIMVIAIFGILSAVTVYNYGKFNANIIMTNMAYEIALSIREAQVYSLGVRGSGGNFNTKYGVYFDSDNGQNFIFFADNDLNKKCDDKTNPSAIVNCSIQECVDSPRNECESLNTLTRGINVIKICVSGLGLDVMDFDNGNCGGNAVSTEKATVTFERPNQDAFVYNMGNGVLGSDQDARNMAVLIEARNGAKRAIHITENGQISVKFINN